MIFFFIRRLGVVFTFFFFFQAEDGIRDKLVTGVQTCALPIWSERQRIDVIRNGRARDARWYVLERIAYLIRPSASRAWGVRLNDPIQRQAGLDRRYSGELPSSKYLVYSWSREKAAFWIRNLVHVARLEDVCAVESRDCFFEGEVVTHLGKVDRVSIIRRVGQVLRPGVRELRR